MASLSSRQFAEWIAYYNVEPWGEERADVRSGVVASTVANIHRKKNTKPFKPIDFMPYLSEEREEMEQKEKQNQLLAMLKGLAANGSR